ncbi:HMG box transcription factor BBX-like [Anneissia japonica]|uniref:HMG box transcription factor BBX-like n=1 Tax=Anneissia japonica TaxID=1529436 RepID=UPI001425AF34|nr:HMG box transcription factor BBX-like [Anneissia japonica]
MPKFTPHHKLMRRFSDPASFQKTEVDISEEDSMSMSIPTTPIDENDIDLVNLQVQNEADLTDDQQLRRPMNAFLLFCKRHRGIVKQKHPWLDNRSCTKMLADMWAVLDPDEKNRYLQLARECKAAFMKAHPDYKWCGTSRHKSSPGACSGASRKAFPMQDVSKLNLSMIAKEGITVGKLADPESMGGLSMLLLAGQTMVKPDSASISTNANQETEDQEDPVSPTSSLFQLAEMCSDRLPMSVMLKKKEMEESVNKTEMKFLNSSIKSEQNKDESNMETSSKKKRRKSEIQSNTSLDKKDNMNKDVSKHSNSRDDDIKKKGSKIKSKGKKKKKSKTRDKETENIESKTSEHDAIDTRDGHDNDEVNGLNSLEETESQDIDSDDIKVESDTDRMSEDGNGIPRRRKSSRSCKGRLYREFVMEGMLETLQRQERPFNCKKTWRHENTTFTDEEDMIFEQEVEKWKKTSRKRPRRRTVSGSGSCNIDYGEINIEAKLAALPQLTMDQFRPKTKAQRSKKSAKMYKNAMFLRKEAKDRAKAKGNVAMIKSRKAEPEITGSRKRKAKKSSIVHLVPLSEEANKMDGCRGSSGGVSDSELGQDEESTAEINNRYHKFSLTDLAEVASRESKPCSSNLVNVSVHKTTTPGAISSASIHRPPLMVP